MKVQAVRAWVPDERRDRYLDAWSEWSGILFAMGIETQLLERESGAGGAARQVLEGRGAREGREFLELTWFEDGNEAALGDDRLVGIAADLDSACERREGALELYRARPATRSSPS